MTHSLQGYQSGIVVNSSGLDLFDEDEVSFRGFATSSSLTSPGTLIATPGPVVGDAALATQFTFFIHEELARAVGDV